MKHLMFIVLALIFSPAFGQETGMQQVAGLPFLRQAAIELSGSSVPQAASMARLRQLFKDAHQVYLKTYVPYSSVDELEQSRKYDCLTATAFMYEVLNTAGFSPSIIETNYHIFLLANVGGKEVLIETTDRIGGIVTGSSRIKERIESYRNLSPSSSEENAYQYRYSFSVFRSVTRTELDGLIQFNQAVRAFNSHQWILSSQFLTAASHLYPSERCDALGELLLGTVWQGQMTEQERALCSEELRKMAWHRVMARANE